MVKLTLRTATIADLDLLCYWDQQPHVVASDPDEDWSWEEELQRFPTWREQLIAEVAGKPIGCLQIIDPAEEETNYWGDVPTNLRAIDIWIGEADYLNKGYGTQMMQQAINRCFANPEVTAILIDPLRSNVGAIRFYKRLGFEFVENRKFEDSDCAVYRLERE